MARSAAGSAALRPINERPKNGRRVGGKVSLRLKDLPPKFNCYGVPVFTKREQAILNAILRANVCPRCGAAPGMACADTLDSTVHVVRIPVGFNAEKALEAAEKSKKKSKKKTRRKQ